MIDRTHAGLFWRSRWMTAASSEAEAYVAGPHAPCRLTASYAQRRILITIWTPNWNWQVGTNRPDRIAAELIEDWSWAIRTRCLANELTTGMTTAPEPRHPVRHPTTEVAICRQRIDQRLSAASCLEFEPQPELHHPCGNQDSRVVSESLREEEAQRVPSIGVERGAVGQVERLGPELDAVTLGR